MNPNLLTRVALTVGSRQAENVATAAVVHLLSANAAARDAAVAHLSAVSSVDLPDHLSLVAQVGQPGGGIADAVAIDAGGVERVIVEAKLTAGFHGEQLSTYVKRLAGQGLLVIVAPERRLGALWRHAGQYLGFEAHQGRCSHVGGVGVAATSWEALLDAIKPAFGEGASSTELDQVVGLIEHVTAGAALPLESDDVTRSRGSTVWSIAQIVERAIDTLAAGGTPLVTVAPRSKGGGFWGAGASVTLAGVTAWFGLWLPAWAKHGDTPYWLQFKGWGSERGSRLATTLGTAPEVEVALHRPLESDVIVGLAAPLIADAAAAVERLVNAVASVAQAVATANDPAP